MKFFRMTLTAALRALRRNKMRSALTILGIVIGVAAVITTVGLGLGASTAIQDQIRSLGTNLLIVVPGTRTRGGAHSGWGGASSLSVLDARAIERESRGVRAVSYARRGSAQVLYGNANWKTTIQATTPSYLDVSDSEVISGEFFDERDMMNGARVVVVGETIVSQLFEKGEDPVGAVIRIKDTSFRVIGVLGSKGGSGFGEDRDDLLLMPFTTAERRVLGATLPGVVQNIIVSGQTGTDSHELSLEIEEILRQRHRLRAEQDSDFTVHSQEEVASTMGNVTRILGSVLMGVASVSLLVGGIGIMNILLVSVTERTREIGIRMAVGAKGRHILVQFLVEAMILSVIGGIIGIALGLAGTQVIAHFAEIPFVFSPVAILGAVLFSGSVGVFFGFYPARKASNLDPIASLRYE
ncbi:MAG TPA: FtsX-like permease family protein [Myxococcales bacterium]|nr:FtsX-like permease family protein [Myxococcales bacterium]HIL80833.1 FtsX-like permease family protein [Myxococcales bacterium]